MQAEEDHLRHLRDLRAQIARQRLKLDARLRAQTRTVRVADFWRRRVQRHPAAALAAALAVGLGAAFGLKDPRQARRGLLRLLRPILGPLAPAVWHFFENWRAKRAAPSPEPAQPEHGQ